jgi:hypothetical protein
VFVRHHQSEADMHKLELSCPRADQSTNGKKDQQPKEGQWKGASCAGNLRYNLNETKINCEEDNK